MNHSSVQSNDRVRSEKPNHRLRMHLLHGPTLLLRLGSVQLGTLLSLCDVQQATDSGPLGFAIVAEDRTLHIESRRSLFTAQIYQRSAT